MAKKLRKVIDDLSNPNAKMITRMNLLFKPRVTTPVPVNHLKKPKIFAESDQCAWFWKPDLQQSFMSFRKRFASLSLSYSRSKPFQMMNRLFPSEIRSILRSVVLQILGSVFHIIHAVVVESRSGLNSLVEDFYSFMDEFFMMGEDVLQPLPDGSGYNGAFSRRSPLQRSGARIQRTTMDYRFAGTNPDFHIPVIETTGLIKALVQSAKNEAALIFQKHWQKITNVFPGWHMQSAHPLFVYYPLNFPFKLPFTTLGTAG